MGKQLVGTLKRHKASGLWFVRIAGKAKYLGTKTTTEEEATNLRKALLADATIISATSDTNEKDQTVEALVEFFLKNSGLPEGTSNTQDKIYYLGHFVGEFGSQKLPTLKPWLVERYLGGRNTWSDTTKRNCLKHLSSCFNWLVRNGQINRNPIDGVKRPLAKARGEEYLITPEEYARLLPAIGPQYREIIELLWHTGGRPSEILTATVEEYHAETHELRKLQHKTSAKGKRRNILLNERADAIIAARVAKVGSGLLFRSSKGNQIHPGTMGQYMRGRFEAAVITHPVCDYSFRHSFAVRCLEAGVPLHDVAALLGNTITVCEQHYGHTLERIRLRRHLLPA